MSSNYYYNSYRATAFLKEYTLHYYTHKLVYSFKTHNVKEIFKKPTCKREIEIAVFQRYYTLVYQVQRKQSPPQQQTTQAISSWQRAHCIATNCYNIWFENRSCHLMTMLLGCICLIALYCVNEVLIIQFIQFGRTDEK